MNRAEKYAGVISSYFLLCVLISFIGWVWETVYMYIITGYFNDRGFLTLPLCPIYASVLLGAYFLLGTVTEGRGILKNVSSESARALIYLSFAFILPTVAEMLVGAFFDKAFGIRLWDYSYMDYNTNGYVALEISVLWGGAIFIFMNRIFLPLKRLVFSIPRRVSYALTIIISVLVMFDIIGIFTK